VVVVLTFDPFRDVDGLVSQVFGSAGSAATSTGSRWMPMDLYRVADDFVVTVDLPGIDPGSIDLTVDGNTLTIRAERIAPAQDGMQWIAQERPHGTYLRQLSLGDGLNVEDVRATYEAGVLAITVPVAEQARRRKINVGVTGHGAVGTGDEQAQPQLTS
jgi:HSP20 family protein